MTAPHMSPPDIRALILIALLVTYDWNEPDRRSQRAKKKRPSGPAFGPKGRHCPLRY